MQPLEKSLRNQLEGTVKTARGIAEAAARATLEQLGVGEANPFAYLSEAERELRRKLRIHGRQLGDERNARSEQEISRLLEEVAYQHWHRMLFARFLAENNLLMYPDPDQPIAVTLEECEELAADEGASNGWELAARFAARMLPQIFRPNSPVFQLQLPPENQHELERLLVGLPQEVFTASDALGWVYQFWQAQKKKEINDAEVKIGARELPAVTQLFTEPYMVSFLLDNSLGAWWAARHLSKRDLQDAESEEELRHKASLPGVPLDYLRFVRDENAAWTPASGTFADWPSHLSKLSTLDPCCGSGHFLVAVFLMLVPMRMALEGLSAGEAVDRVLAENIHGLELDQRCVELAAFAVALAAWRYPEAGGYRLLPELNIACSGLSVSTDREEWLSLAGNNAVLRMALDELYNQFKEAPTLGSLINPETSLQRGSLFELQWDEIRPLLRQALFEKRDEEKVEIGVVAQGLTKAANLLSQRYQFVITNVPYLKRGNQSPIIQDFCEINYKQSKSCLSSTFLDRCIDFGMSHASLSVVCPQPWLFLTSYHEFRKRLLQKHSWRLITALGHSAFETISGHVVDVVLLHLVLNDQARTGKWIDVNRKENAAKKSEAIKGDLLHTFDQNTQLSHPESRVVFGDLKKGVLLNEYANSVHGQGSFDDPSYVRNFWEMPILLNGWIYQQTSGRSDDCDQGCFNVFHWEGGTGRLATMMAAKEEQGYSSGKWKAGKSAWGHSGVAISGMGRLYVNRYQGGSFDTNVAVIFPYQDANFEAIWAYCRSNEFIENIRKIDRKPKVTPKTFGKIPFDLDYWTRVAEEQYPAGLPKPYSDDPTQWIFHGHPCGSVVWDDEMKCTTDGRLRVDDTVLQVAVARLLDYHWPAELNAAMELSAEARAWVAKAKALHPFADEDGIVCLPPVRGEPTAADRLLDLLAAAYGDSWRNDTLGQLLRAADHADKSLESWLRDKFFSQHCKLFQQRPFIWHIWDGLNDGFAALVNVHKLDRKTLETLTYTYVGDWITRQRSDKAAGVDGAEEKLAAAEQLQKRLELILQGEAPYDIFVRWKALADQPIGWQPDLNDGVRLNIRPFLSVPDVGKKGAGILRDKPNIKWEKDRGKDVESAPWYHLFDGDRINDHHLSLAEKRAAQPQVRKEITYD